MYLSLTFLCFFPLFCLLSPLCLYLFFFAIFNNFFLSLYVSIFLSFFFYLCLYHPLFFLHFLVFCLLPPFFLSILSSIFKNFSSYVTFVSFSHFSFISACIILSFLHFFLCLTRIFLLSYLPPLNNLLLPRFVISGPAVDPLKVKIPYMQLPSLSFKSSIL